MNSTAPSFPSLTKLYWNDIVIRRAVNAFAFGILLAVGIHWASQPQPNAPVLPGSSASHELELVPYIMLGGAVLSVLGLLFFIRRYLLVKKILTHGETVKGLVETLDVHASENKSDTDSPSTTTYTRSYYATIRYPWRGGEKKIRLKLPSAGFVYGLAKGRETDLIIHASFPKKPLIRTVYLGKF